MNCNSAEMASAGANIPSKGLPAEPAPGTRVGEYEVAVHRFPGELARIAEEWRELAQSAVEPNPFYEPWMFLPATGMAAGARWQIVTVWKLSTSGRKRELTGFFPFVEKRLEFGLRNRCLSLFQHRYCFLTAPIVKCDEARPVLEVVIEFLRTRETGGLIEFPLINSDGPLQCALIDVVRQRLLTVYYVDQHNRGLLQRDTENAEEYLHIALGRKLRELRRLRRRMGERGQVELRIMSPGQASLWAEWFLELEAKGWKGERGTAIVRSEADAEFFRKAVLSGAEAGLLEMLGLFMNGEPVALKCNLRSGAGSFAFKIAYDESLAKYSPGTQLEMEMMRRFWAEAEVEWVDSCASPNHFMINRLWLDRRPIQHVVISTGRPACDLMLAAAPLARAVWRIGGRVTHRIASLIRLGSQDLTDASATTAAESPH